MKVRMLLVCLMTVLFGETLCAQTREVSISDKSSSTFQGAVASALRARIGATTRYTLTTSEKSELAINLVCLDVPKIAPNLSGGVCAYTLTYTPQELAGLSEVMSGPSVLSNPDPSGMAETIFEDFVSATSEAKLRSTLGGMLGSIRYFEMMEELEKLAK